MWLTFFRHDDPTSILILICKMACSTRRRQNVRICYFTVQPRSICLHCASELFAVRLTNNELIFNHISSAHPLSGDQASIVVRLLTCQLFCLSWCLHQSLWSAELLRVPLSWEVIGLPKFCPCFAEILIFLKVSDWLQLLVGSFNRSYHWYNSIYFVVFCLTYRTISVIWSKLCNMIGLDHWFSLKCWFAFAAVRWC